MDVSNNIRYHLFDSIAGYIASRKYSQCFTCCTFNHVIKNGWIKFLKILHTTPRIDKVNKDSSLSWTGWVAVCFPMFHLWADSSTHLSVIWIIIQLFFRPVFSAILRQFVFFRFVILTICSAFCLPGHWPHWRFGSLAVLLAHTTHLPALLPPQSQIAVHLRLDHRLSCSHSVRSRSITLLTP